MIIKFDRTRCGLFELDLRTRPDIFEGSFGALYNLVGNSLLE